jgi:hypothetical protein
MIPKLLAISDDISTCNNKHEGYYMIGSLNVYTLTRLLSSWCLLLLGG